MRVRRKILGMGVGLLLLCGAAGNARAQASTLPSAAPVVGTKDDPTGSVKGHKLLDQMVAALGGDAWLNRQDWTFQGRAATFYKGRPHDETPEFEEYYRAHPFGERVVVISYFSTIPGLPGRNHRDLAEVWTAETGYEVTYKGKKPLLEKDIEEHQRWRKHSLDTVVEEWLKQPDVVVAYEGTSMSERHLADKVSVLTAQNDAVTLELDESTHLPLSLTFQWRDPLYKDTNTDVEQFDDYHVVQGIETPFAITRLHNGDMTGQRFFTKIVYNSKLDATLFDPDRALTKNGK